MKRLLLIVLVLSLVPLVSFYETAKAHELASFGGESSGYKYVGAHWSTTSTKYFVATSSTWGNRFDEGRAKFHSETKWKFSITKATSSNTNNFIENYSCSTCTWVARRTFFSITKQHPQRWRIQFNSAKSANSWKTVAAHEIGHVFGLADLYESRNTNKLMYGRDNGVRYVQSVEMTGFNKIY